MIVADGRGKVYFKGSTVLLCVTPTPTLSEFLPFGLITSF